MIYELRTYEAAPGKLPALNARFRDHTRGLFERHGMEVVGFWTYAHGGSLSQRRLTTTRGYRIGCLTTRTLNCPANGNRRYRTTWQRRMRFRGLKFDSDTSGAAVVSALARSGVARRNQGV